MRSGGCGAHGLEWSFIYYVPLLKVLLHVLFAELSGLNLGPMIILLKFLF